MTRSSVAFDRAGEMASEMGDQTFQGAQSAPPKMEKFLYFIHYLCLKRVQLNKINIFPKKKLDLHGGETFKGPKMNPSKTRKVTRFDKPFLDREI